MAHLGHPTYKHVEFISHKDCTKAYKNRTMPAGTTSDQLAAPSPNTDINYELGAAQPPQRPRAGAVTGGYYLQDSLCRVLPWHVQNIYIYLYRHIFRVSHILTALHVRKVSVHSGRKGRSTVGSGCQFMGRHRRQQCSLSANGPSRGAGSVRASSADVPASVPVLKCRLALKRAEEGVLEGRGQGHSLGGLVFQHALDQAEQLVVLLCLHHHVPP